jgi:hypothetical protein
MSDDDAAPDGPAMPLADWRRPSQEQRIDAVPAHLRERLAATAERVAEGRVPAVDEGGA